MPYALCYPAYSASQRAGSAVLSGVEVSAALRPASGVHKKSYICRLEEIFVHIAAFHLPGIRH